MRKLKPAIPLAEFDVGLMAIVPLRTAAQEAWSFNGAPITLEHNIQIHHAHRDQRNCTQPLQVPFCRT